MQATQKLTRHQQWVMDALVQDGKLNGFILVTYLNGEHSSPGIYAGLRTGDTQHQEYIEAHNERCQRVIEAYGRCDGIGIWSRWDLRNMPFSITTFNCLVRAEVITKSSESEDLQFWVAKL